MRFPLLSRAPRMAPSPPKRPPYRRVADFVSVLPLGLAELAFRHGDVAFCQVEVTLREEHQHFNAGEGGVELALNCLQPSFDVLFAFEPIFFGARHFLQSGAGLKLVPPLFDHPQPGFPVVIGVHSSLDLFLSKGSVCVLLKPALARDSRSKLISGKASRSNFR